MLSNAPASSTPHVFDVTLARFEQEVLLKSREVPVLVDFWAPWCGPCKTLGPILEKLAAEFNGGFLLAKVDVDKEQQLAAYFQVRSVPTVVLLKGGQIADGFPGALPEGALREFLKKHAIEPLAVAGPAPEVTTPLDYEAEVIRLRHEVALSPDKAELQLDLALALLAVSVTTEAAALLDALPANLATDDRAMKARAKLTFAALAKDAPDVAVLETAIAAQPDDLRARHLLGACYLIDGRHELALMQLLEMLKRDRSYADGLPRKSLIDAFRAIDDPELVGVYRRKMAALLF